MRIKEANQFFKEKDYLNALHKYYLAISEGEALVSYAQLKPTINTLIKKIKQGKENSNHNNIYSIEAGPDGFFLIYKHNPNQLEKILVEKNNQEISAAELLRILSSHPATYVLLTNITLFTASIALALNYLWDSKIFTLKHSKFHITTVNSPRQIEFMSKKVDTWSIVVNSIYDLKAKNYNSKQPPMTAIALARESLKRINFIFDQSTTISLEGIIAKRKRLLIAGSAPTLKESIMTINKTDYDIWALNDAIFFLEKNHITVNCAIVTDSRFLRTKAENLLESKVKTLITLDSVDLRPILKKKWRICILKNLGRDGFSTTAGEAYHGCTVFHVALQVAFSKHYRELATAGVMLSPPFQYTRLDGSFNMPEYVYESQINNVRNAKKILHENNIQIKTIEKSSVIEYL